MIKRLRKKASMTLVETLVAMLILTTSAAGVLGSFSYSFKLIERAGRKIEAMNCSRKVMELYRAIWMADPADARLAITDNPQNDNYQDITTILQNAPYGIVSGDYNGKIKLKIYYWDGDTGTPQTIKQISVKVDWPAP